jgi:Tfp pilus assembly protein PilX
MRRALQVRRRRERGSALVMAIVVSVVITGLVITLAWAGGVQAEMTGNLMKMDQAFYTAESGAQRVAWYVKHSKAGTTASPLTGVVGGYAYSAGWTVVSGSTVRVTSTGSLGNVAYTCYQTIAPGATAPAMADAGNLLISGNMNIVGNQEISGTVTLNGGAKLNVTGNLAVGSTISGSPTVTGTKTTNAKGLNPPNVNSIYTTESALAVTTITGSAGISVLNFTTATNGIILVNGDANISSNVTVIGSGTLIVTGNMNLSGNLPVTGSASMNIIVKGDTNISGNLNIKGSLYGVNNWNISGTYNITGVVLIAGITQGAGNGTITMASPPSFDPRGGGGGGSTSLTNFAGPLP